MSNTVDGTSKNRNQYATPDGAQSPQISLSNTEIKDLQATASGGGENAKLAADTLAKAGISVKDPEQKDPSGAGKEAATDAFQRGNNLDSKKNFQDFMRDNHVAVVGNKKTGENIEVSRTDSKKPSLADVQLASKANSGDPHAIEEANKKGIVFKKIDAASSAKISELFGKHNRA